MEQTRFRIVYDAAYMIGYLYNFLRCQRFGVNPVNNRF